MICWLCNDQAMQRPPLPFAALGQRRRRSDMIGLPPCSTVIDTASLLPHARMAVRMRRRSCFVVHGGAFSFATTVGSRLRNLEAHGLGLACRHGGDTHNDVAEDRPHVALTAEGPVTLHAIEALALVGERVTHRHERPPTWAAALVELSPGAPVQLRRQLAKTAGMEIGSRSKHGSTRRATRTSAVGFRRRRRVHPLQRSLVYASPARSCNPDADADREAFGESRTGWCRRVASRCRRQHRPRPRSPSSLAGSRRWNTRSRR